MRSVDEWFWEEYLYSFEELVEGVYIVVVEDVFSSLEDVSEMDEVVLAESYVGDQAFG